MSGKRKNVHLEEGVKPEEKRSIKPQPRPQGKPSQGGSGTKPPPKPK